ncbi:zf-TFIIB domain-containing protein [Devosia sp. 1635]|uniref:TFIIB-type zinc ribbon-containing protein n=1 Tax=Devosia sp. 1635 TaxID=2726066 RepID=UPI0015662193|nr:zf-TFIIB domain-containing protein [Devosia sp. 1635]
MNCPHHGVPLFKSKNHGIEIDYCPECHGAWFDRGELDKIIEAYREMALQAQPLPKQHGSARRYENPRARSLKKIADLLEEIFD